MGHQAQIKTLNVLPTPSIQAQDQTETDHQAKLETWYEPHVKSKPPTKMRRVPYSTDSERYMTLESNTRHIAEN